MMNNLDVKTKGQNNHESASLFSAEVSLCDGVQQGMIGAISFDVSDNEEQVVLMIEVEGRKVLVDANHCLYMLLLLARARMIDQVSGLSDEQLGWLSTSEFFVMLGCKQQMFYQQMLRFAKTWEQEVLDSRGHSTSVKIPALIEVDEGRIRFAYDDIQINCSKWSF